MVNKSAKSKSKGKAAKGKGKAARSDRPSLAKSSKSSKTKLARSKKERRERILAFSTKIPGEEVGFSVDRAWALAMRPGGSGSITSMKGGGYAVLRDRKLDLKPPSKIIPVVARMPSGWVKILPDGDYNWWRVVVRA